MYFDSSSNTLYLPDGSRNFFSSTEVSIHGKLGRAATAYIDRNGNTLSFDIQNRSWRRHLGSHALRPYPKSAACARGQTYALPGIYSGGPTTLAYKLRWANLGNVLRISAPLRYTGDKKCSPSITDSSPALFQSFDSVTFLCAKLAGGNPELFNPVVLSEVELANGKKYQFKYNIYGEIEQVFLPTGGYERFEYGIVGAISDPAVPYHQGNRGVINHWISADGITDGTPWHYSGGGGFVATTAPDGSYTERRFGPAVLRDISIRME